MSPLEFCLGHAALGERFSQEMVGLGLDPPMEAIVAYRTYADGSTDANYNRDDAVDLHMMVNSGALTLPDTMAVAGDDTTRLILLDLASTTKRDARFFIDDTQCPVAGQGHVRKALEVMGLVASDDQYEYKSEKMKITAKDFSSQAPVQLQGGTVKYASALVSLGFTDPHDHTGEGHLCALLKRGRSTFTRVYSGIVAAGLPMEALLKAVPQRIIPSSLFGGHLILHNQSSEKLVNRLQADWMHTILKVHKRLPRIVMMWELGFLDRASALLWKRAIALWLRIRTNYKYLKLRAAKAMPGVP